MNNLEKYLKDIGEQKEKEIKELEIRINQRLEKICKAYERWLEQKMSGVYTFTYPLAFSLTEKLKCTSEDITLFSLELTKYEDREYFETSGFFLSALINQGKDEEYTIITERLNKKIDLIGYKNNKKLIVKGNVGDEIGWLNEGEIIINGNVGYNVGLNNQGIIKVNGEIKSLDPFAKGKIYHKDKLRMGKENG